MNNPVLVIKVYSSTRIAGANLASQSERWLKFVAKITKFLMKWKYRYIINTEFVED